MFIVLRKDDLYSCPIRPAFLTCTTAFLSFSTSSTNNTRLHTTYQRRPLTDCSRTQELYFYVVTTVHTRFGLPTYADHGTKKYILPVLKYICYIAAIYSVFAFHTIAIRTAQVRCFASVILYLCFNENSIIFSLFAWIMNMLFIITQHFTPVVWHVPFIYSSVEFYVEIFGGNRPPTILHGHAI